MLAKAANLIQFLRVQESDEAPFSFRAFLSGLDEREGARPWIFVPRKEDYFEARSEEHTSELQSLMRISYAVFCLKKKKKTYKKPHVEAPTQSTPNTMKYLHPHHSYVN